MMLADTDMIQTVQYNSLPLTFITLSIDGKIEYLFRIVFYLNIFIHSIMHHLPLYFILIVFCLATSDPSNINF